MKRILLLLVCTCVMLSASGCKTPIDLPFEEPAEKVFSVEAYGLQLTADTSFAEATAGEFDLQIKNDYAYISIMAYRYTDLSEELTPLQAFQMQNEDIFSRREEVQLLEEEKTESFSDHTLTKALYSAKRDGVKNHYAMYLVDFPEKEIFAWVLVSAMPVDMESEGETLHKIVSSLKPIA